MRTPEQIAADICDGLSFSTNRMHNGRLVGEQYFASQAIYAAIKAERDRYAPLISAAFHAEAVMSIVEPRSDKKEYLETLFELRRAIASATP